MNTYQAKERAAAPIFAPEGDNPMPVSLSQRYSSTHLSEHHVRT